MIKKMQYMLPLFFESPEPPFYILIDSLNSLDDIQKCTQLPFKYFSKVAEACKYIKENLTNYRVCIVVIFDMAKKMKRLIGGIKQIRKVICHAPYCI